MLNLPLRATAALLSLCFATASLAGPVAIEADKNRIKAHLRFLADDLLEGRETGTRGFDIAANYVASQFVQYGVAPKGDDGGFLQTVHLRNATLAMDSPVFELITKDGRQALEMFKDFTMQASVLETQSEVTAPLVFVGYGIEAPSYQHDDYAGIDVKGKIVVVLGGRPARLPTEEGAHFSSPDHKREAAARHGAVGMVTVNLPRPGAAARGPGAASPDAMRAYLARPRMTWTNKEGQAAHEFPSLQNSASMTAASAAKLFSESGLKLEDIQADAAAGKALPHADLKLSAHLAKKSGIVPLKSSNVVGVIEGSDPALKNEYVLFTAHLDHLGYVPGKAGDNVYNGAMDNASGVATLIETARLVARMPVKPKRSILFVALTGEEKGLLGSAFFAAYPTVPAGSIVANVNLDMPMLTYDFANVVAFGAEHSSLKDTIANAAKKLNLGLIPDPWPEQRLFTRSDHYNFVRKGVPSVFLVTGLGSFNKDEAPQKLWDEFMSKHYHKVSDDLNQPMNFDAAARFAQVNFNIGIEIANDKARPTWNKGDFFGDTFGTK